MDIRVSDIQFEHYVWSLDPFLVTVLQLQSLELVTRR